jgi:hypothetical protein
MSDKLPMPYPKGYYGTYWRDAPEGRAMTPDLDLCPTCGALPVDQTQSADTMPATISAMPQPSGAAPPSGGAAAPAAYDQRPGAEGNMFLREDFAHVAEMIRVATWTNNARLLRALLSNNLNIILAALDAAGGMFEEVLTAPNDLTPETP